MAAFLQKCKRCLNEFPYVHGKRFCHKVCRNTYYREARSEEDFAINSLPVIDPPPDVVHQFVDKPLDAPIKFVIENNAPEGAIGFRLGVMNSGSRRNKNPRMKWFPYKPFRTPAVYHLLPWETTHVPFPGSYAVCYFDENYVPIAVPTFQVNIRFPAPMFPWCAGDDQMMLNLKKYL